MAEGTKEWHFEEDLVKYMTRDIVGELHEYVQKDTGAYDKELCLIPEDVLAFIKETQADTYAALIRNKDPLEEDKQIINKISSELTKHKTLEVLREPIRYNGERLRMAFFKPNHDRSPEHLEGYKKNRLTVVRQLKYSTRNENSIDVVLFVNGIPVVTLELKNSLTGQHVNHAIQQYIKDRDPKEKLLEFERCLVHFALGTDKVSMCTKLAGKDTFFLPFNKDLVNENPEGFATAYMWQDILTKDSLFDLIQNYINLQVEKEKVYDPSIKGLKEIQKKKLVFPRYHQRRAVSRLLAAVRKEGVGGKYLIQHSAGSGKSNTIAWLAHRLSDFFQQPSDERALFTSTLVVTDRTVLDKQIQDNIKQFDNTPGAVAYIGPEKTSQDLREAIESGKRVIVTTLQKFPVISEYVSQNLDRTYAVIIDEAHSSQSGEAARHLRKALSLDEAEAKDTKEPELDDLIEEEIKKKGNQPNISFFAFTATPKPRTIELFGTVAPNGDKVPFDTYSMEQAIKEEFIKDVLQNYMSWKRYYKLVKRTEVEDKEYEKKRTVRVLSSFVDLQDHAIETKTRVMLEHFTAHTQKEIQGQARAMLVTRSRLHAVRYKRKFDEIMREMKLPYNALVAFSGTVTDAETGEDYTMTSMNELGGKISVPDALKLPQYRILIVANMYQTGFDEPLLHTMFVDKKLGGTNSVQTLSRLNRTMRGKDSTMILDFVNDPEQIQQDFQEYYGDLFMPYEDQTDPNTLYDVLHKVEGASIVYKTDIEAFANYFFRKGDHKEKLHPILNAIVARYEKELDEDSKVAFKSNAKDFVRLYRFLSQVISFTDVELEKWYVLLVNLAKKLPSTGAALPLEVLAEVELDSFKLQHQFTTALKLESNSATLQGMQPGHETKKPEEEIDWLTGIIKKLNDTFGLDLSEEDKVEFEKMRDSLYSNEELMSYFNKNNSKDNIKDKFNEEVDNELLNFINTKLEFYNKLTEDKVNNMFKSAWFTKLYDDRVRGLNR